MIEQAKLDKYEKSIQELIERRELDDLILIQTMQMEALSILGFAKNMKEFSEKYYFDGMKENVKFMKDCLKRMDLMLIEVDEKAHDNES